MHMPCLTLQSCSLIAPALGIGRKSGLKTPSALRNFHAALEVKVTESHCCKL